MLERQKLLNREELKISERADCLSTFRPRAHSDPNPLYPSFESPGADILNLYNYVHNFTSSPQKRYMRSESAVEKIAESVKEGLIECSTSSMLLSCPACNHQKKVILTCKVRICGKEPCVKFRSNRVLNELSQVVKQFDKKRKPMLITLTLKGHHKLSKVLKTRFDSYLRRFIRRFELRGIRIIEIKLKKNDLYYYHYHLLVDSCYIPQKEISKEWFKISGSSIVDVRRISVLYGLGYLVKRSASPMVVRPTGQAKLDGHIDQDNEAIIEKYVRHVYKSRFYSVFGKFYIVETNDNEILCPNCKNLMVYEGVENIFESISEVIFVLSDSVSHQEKKEEVNK